jgi:hypothetical protein
MVSDSAQTEDAAVLVRDRLQEQVGTTPRDCPAHSTKYCFALDEVLLRAGLDVVSQHT